MTKDNATQTYFAYGTLLGTPAMQEYCPTATAIAIARLADFQLEFRQYSSDASRCGCNLRSAPGTEMYGVIYEVSEPDMDALDEASGVPAGWFRRSPISVERLDGNRLETTTYFLTDPGEAMCPEPAYLALVDEGARTSGIPSTYADQLRRTLAELAR